MTPPADHVVVVGAGLAGLSAALHLAGRGRNVTVVERGAHPGGRMGRMDVKGYRIDTGPTVLTMPDILEDTMNAVGESLSDRLNLRPIDPSYRACFADGTVLDVHRDADAMAEEVRRLMGPTEALGYLRLRDWLTQLYRVEFDGFISANFDSPLSLLSPRLAQLVALGGFRRWETMMRRFVTDERLLRVFSFQALYAGVAPQRALAVYAVIAYMDTVAGVYFPDGGMRSVPDALAAAAVHAGVHFRYDATVSELERSGGSVRAVLTDDGQRLSADAVVLTTELPVTYRLLGRRPRRPIPLRPAPSAVIAHLGCRAAEHPDVHHSILFGRRWDQTFAEIIDEGVTMSDPSLLVTRPTASDPSLAPPGRDLLYVLAPAPNLARGQVNWPRDGAGYVQDVIAAARGRLPHLGADLEVLHTVDPHGWSEQGMLAGTPFALAHTFGQTGPFRPANRVRGIDNVALAGSSTVPGVGVPTALLSGRLAADRITGGERTDRHATIIDGVR